MSSSLDDGEGDARSPSKRLLRYRTTGDPVRVLRPLKCAKGASSSSNAGSVMRPVRSAYHSDCLHPETPLQRINSDGRAPRLQLLTSIGCIGQWMSIQCANVALSTLNKKCRAQGEPEYELVKELQCIQFIRDYKFHSNFVARPKNGSLCDDKLFFAEMKTEPKVCRGGEVRRYHICSFYCILDEPIDSKSEALPSGCESCDRHPGCVEHPPNMKWSYGVLH